MWSYADIITQHRTCETKGNNHQAIIVGISSPGAFNQVAKQQWNFPSYVGTLYLHLAVTSVSKLAGCGQSKPVPAHLV